MAEKKSTSVRLNTLKITGVEFLEVIQLKITHEANEYARARLTLVVDGEKGQKFIEQAGADKIKISGKAGDKDVVLFQGYIVNLIFEPRYQRNLLTIELCDAAYLLTLKRETSSFQKLDAKYADILKTALKSTDGTKVTLKVTDKAIEKMIVRLNETGWDFLRRMASHFSAMVFTDITAEKPLITIGLPDPKQTIDLEEAQATYTHDPAAFGFLDANKDVLLAKGAKIVAEDFSTVAIGGCQQYLNVGDAIKLNKKEYRVKGLNATFRHSILEVSYTLVGKTAFVVPLTIQQNLHGRVFRAQVKKVEKDKVQAHLIDVDEKFDSSGKMMFPFATAYSSADGSGWYAMPEVDDYVRVMFPSIDPSEAFAISSINTAPLKEPKNKSFKAPGGREILLTDKGVEIIAEHQKTFILIDKDKGISVVSAKDIQIHADGNVSFDAKGKIQMVAQKEITAQSGQSHVKILSNQIDMGGSNIIVGE
ncbi:MAG: hypothetical protein IJ668_01185 [Selenomonadaceae bacterium]|nr:hypothetical protein [Selenomonadaceae bacterium]